MRRATSLVVLAASALALAGCGGGSNQSAGETSASTSTETTTTTTTESTSTSTETSTETQAGSFAAGDCQKLAQAAQSFGAALAAAARSGGNQGSADTYQKYADE